MAFFPERFSSGSVAANRDHPLTTKIQELSRQYWTKDTILLGHHSAFLKVLLKLEQFALSLAPVLITGESGVGKELFASALYLLSERSNATYVPVNCGQFSDEHLMVSELFGHAKGSFTGATHDRQGVFESANGGTIFLDEIGELSMCAQKMLLRVIDQQEIMPLGSTKIRQVNVRVISATHRDLTSMVEAGKFREDLFYRLSCLHLHIPALRERGDDRVLLLTHYLDQLNTTHGVQKQFSSEALDFLKTYSFSGNIRELKNVVETGFRVSCGDRIQLDDITEKLQHRRKTDVLPLDLSGFYNRLVDKGESFWKVIHEPFLNRDLNRQQVQAILQRGLKETGSYKSLMKLFNIAEAEYKKFLNFLQQHNLKP